VHVNLELCQGHTLCAMIAPDVFTLDEADGHFSALDGEVAADQEVKAAEAIRSCPGKSHLHHLLGRQEGKRVSTEPIATGDAERKKNRFHFDRHTPEYRERFADITGEMLESARSVE